MNPFSVSCNVEQLRLNQAREAARERKLKEEAAARQKEEQRKIAEAERREQGMLLYFLALGFEYAMPVSN